MKFTWYTYARAFVRAQSRFRDAFDVLDIDDAAHRIIMWRACNHMIMILARTGREKVKAPPAFIARPYMKMLNKEYGLEDNYS